MNELRIKNIKEGMEEVLKDFLRWEMAIPEDEISKLQFSRISRKEGNTKLNDDRLYVEFVAIVCLQVCQGAEEPL